MCCTVCFDGVRPSLLNNSGGTTVGSGEVLSPVALNGCQVSSLGGFHPNSSLETAEGLLASQQAGALLMQTAPGTEEGCGRERKRGRGRERGRERGGTSLSWFYTHAHATADPSVGIAPDTRHATDKADKHGGMRERESGRRAKREGVGVRAQWLTDSKLMGRGGSNGLWSGRPREMREPLPVSTDSSPQSLSIFYCLNQSHTPRERGTLSLSHTHTHTRTHTPLRSREMYQQENPC